MPATILGTKLYVPQTPPNAVLRPHLSAQLDEALRLNRRLVLLSAPPGFGKTVLLSQWIAALRSRAPAPGQAGSDARARAAWLSLDAGDSDPARFLAYVVAALQQVDPCLGAGVSATLAAPAPPPGEVLLADLLNDMATVLPSGAGTGRYVLVLDDYHAIASQRVHGAVTFLLEHLPPGWHLVVSTRVDPPLPLGRLRARGQLAQLSAVDLRFSADEAAAFLNRAMGLDLAPGDVLALQSRTEGWIAGLQLAALSMQGRAPVERGAFVAAFTGSNRYVLDYLAEEVLQRQPAAVQEFLMRTSVVERLSAELCDALREPESGHRGDSREVLERLESANLFILPLDDQRCWYRYHHLFADLLRHRLRVTHAEWIPALHRRASRWYAEHDMGEDAVRHALLAEDWAGAAGLISACASTLLKEGQVLKLLDWMASLPEAIVAANPMLSLARAWAAAVAEQFDLADQALAHAERASRGAPAVAVEALCVRTYIARARGDSPGAIELGRQAMEVLPSEDAERRGIVALALATAYWRTGDFERAADAFDETRRLAEQTGNALAWTSSVAMLARIGAARGDLREAARMLQDALGTRDGYYAARQNGVLYLELAALYYEWNDLAKARELAGLGLQQSQRTGSGEIETWCRRLHGRIRAAAGDPAGAYEALDLALQAARRHRQPQVVQDRVVAEYVRTALGAGDLPAAVEWAGRIVHDVGSAHHHPEINLEPARLALARGDRAAARLELERRWPIAVDRGLRYAQIEIRVLQALASDDEDAARACLLEALEWAAPAGYVRVFLDEGAALIPWLRRSAGHGALRDYAGRLLAAHASEGAEVRRPGPQSAQPLVEPPTERELEVLHLIAAGLSNHEIAARLVIAMGTIKAHTASLYRKLDVDSRTRAVARARALGLLENGSPTD